jgi:hypothetical protein
MASRVASGSGQTTLFAPEFASAARSGSGGECVSLGEQVGAQLATESRFAAINLQF